MIGGVLPPARPPVRPARFPVMPAAASAVDPPAAPSLDGCGAVFEVLEAYRRAHPRARFAVTFREYASRADLPPDLSVKVVDPDAAGLSRGERFNRLWTFLQNRLPGRIAGGLHLAHVLTPPEAARLAQYEPDCGFPVDDASFPVDPPEALRPVAPPTDRPTAEPSAAADDPALAAA